MLSDKLEYERARSDKDTTATRSETDTKLTLTGPGETDTFTLAFTQASEHCESSSASHQLTGHHPGPRGHRGDLESARTQTHTHTVGFPKGSTVVQSQRRGKSQGPMRGTRMRSVHSSALDSRFVTATCLHMTSVSLRACGTKGPRSRERRTKRKHKGRACRAQPTARQSKGQPPLSRLHILMRIPPGSDMTLAASLQH